MGKVLKFPSHRARKVEPRGSKRRYAAYAAGVLEPTPENLAAASDFLLEKWVERATESRFTGETGPTDLSGACKFASLFAQRVFGGRLRGSWHHEYVEHPTAGVIDLTGAQGVSLGHSHDRFWWGNHEHVETLESCEPRVDRWVAEFLARRGG